VFVLFEFTVKSENFCGSKPNCFTRLIKAEKSALIKCEGTQKKYRITYLTLDDGTAETGADKIERIRARTMTIPHPTRRSFRRVLFSR
jgi:hypothetical protein